MNPFSRYLRQWLPDRRLDEFVAQWDALEALVVRVYKEEGATAADMAEFDRLRPWLQSRYPDFKAQLRPFWQQAMVAGERTAADPFKRLLSAADASAFVGDWTNLQFLPAAREALNRCIRAHAVDD